MSTATATAPDHADTPEHDARHLRRALHELVDMGMDIARIVHADAKAGTGTADPTTAFDRIARTVRRTVLLLQKLDAPTPPAAAHPVSDRRRILREVEDTIQRKATGPEAESLNTELLDRLDGPDLLDEIGRRPVADIIADLVHDLGLVAIPGAHPWKRRTPADIALLCARAAAPAPAPDRHPRTASPPGQRPAPARMLAGT